MTPWTEPTRLLCPWDSPGKNTAVGCHFFLRGIFPTQGSNLCLLCLLHWQAGSLPLCHWEAQMVQTLCIWVDTDPVPLLRVGTGLCTVTCFIAVSPVNMRELCSLKHTSLEPLIQFIARPYSDSSRNESWYSLIYNKFWKGAEMTLLHLELCILYPEWGKSREVELKHDLKFHPWFEVSCPRWMYLKWKRQMRLRPQSPPLKSDGWFSSVWELQGLPRSVAVTPAEKGCHQFGMPYILCYFLLPQVKCRPRSVRAQTADQKECGAGCVPGYRGDRRWKSGKTHLACVWHNLTAVTSISASTHPAWCLTLGTKKIKRVIFFFSIMQ